MEKTPFDGIGKPEALKYEFSDFTNLHFVSYLKNESKIS